MNVISNLVVIYSIFAANLKICLYLHLTRFIIDSHVRRSTTPIAITHSHITSVRILSFSFQFFPFTLFVCVNKNKMHNYSLNHRSEQRRQKAVKLPYKQTLSLILIAIHTQRSIILYSTVQRSFAGARVMTDAHKYIQKLEAKKSFVCQ